MRTVLCAAVLALGLGGLAGCSSSSPATSDVKAPAPQDSGSFNEKAPKQPRIPKAPGGVQPPPPQ